MTVSNALQEHLNAQRIPFDVLMHSPTGSAARSAQVSHVSGECLAKAVVLKDDVGFLLAILPATHHIRFDLLFKVMGRNLSMAPEAEASELFVDCELGAFPPAGGAYGLEMVVERALEGKPDIYLEGGDHTCLVHVRGDDFERLTRNAIHGRFSTHD